MKGGMGREDKIERKGSKEEGEREAQRKEARWGKQFMKDDLFFCFHKP